MTSWKTPKYIRSWWEEVLQYMQVQSHEQLSTPTPQSHPTHTLSLSASSFNSAFSVSLPFLHFFPFPPFLPSLHPSLHPTELPRHQIPSCLDPAHMCVWARRCVCSYQLLKYNSWSGLWIHQQTKTKKKSIYKWSLDAVQWQTVFTGYHSTSEWTKLATWPDFESSYSTHSCLLRTETEPADWSDIYKTKKCNVFDSGAAVTF